MVTTTSHKPLMSFNALTGFLVILTVDLRGAYLHGADLSGFQCPYGLFGDSDRLQDGETPVFCDREKRVSMPLRAFW